MNDANFNVTGITASSANVIERYSYTPYGEATVLDADYSADADGLSDISNELLYTGRRLDPETGLQLNRNRFYAAGLGRWVNRDPLANAILDRSNLFLELTNRIRERAPSEVQADKLIRVVRSNSLLRQLLINKLVIQDISKPMPGYADGMSLYAAYFVPNKLDPQGTLVVCTGGGAFGGWGIGGSISTSICKDDCGSPPTNVTCVGGGVAFGGSARAGGSGSEGCLDDCPVWNLTGQGAAGPIGVSGTLGDTGGGGGNSTGGGGVSGGVGAGVGAFVEYCWRSPIGPPKNPPAPPNVNWIGPGMGGY